MQVIEQVSYFLHCSNSLLSRITSSSSWSALSRSLKYLSSEAARRFKKVKVTSEDNLEEAISSELSDLVTNSTNSDFDNLFATPGGRLIPPGEFTIELRMFFILRGEE